MAMAKPWNPMADTDGNREFNNYQQGPGENVDDSHQPGAMKKSRYIKSEYRLCLKYVPKNMSTQDVQDLCSSYAKVIDIHTPHKTPFIFVSFETFNDMNRVWTGLEDNPHGIRAHIAEYKKEPFYTGSESGKGENENPALSNLNSGYIKSEYRLCLKYVPKNMSTKDVQDLCSVYAEVIDFHTTLKTPFIFVSVKTFNDMNRVWTELKECGIRAEIANHKTYNKNKNPPVSHLNMSLRPSQMDMKNQRSIKGPFQRPQLFRRQPLVTSNDC